MANFITANNVSATVYSMVVTGNNGTVLQSADGVKWALQSTGTNADLNAVVASVGVLPSNQFVAVGNAGLAFTSTDGINWTVIRMPATLNWTGIAFGNGKWVAVGGPSSISATSSDGINWTKVTLPKSASWTSVAYGNGQFLMSSSTGVSLFSK
jgi:hypothetical protein